MEDFTFCSAIIAHIRSVLLESIQSGILSLLPFVFRLLPFKFVQFVFNGSPFFIDAQYSLVKKEKKKIKC